MKIPVVINNRDQLTWPKAMLEKIKTYKNVGEIIIVDNESTYTPLLDWYKTNPCKIVKVSNLGHAAPWISGVVNSLNTPYYIVSDSDLGLEDTPDDTLDYLYEKLIVNNLDKIGLGLDWKKVVLESPYYNHIQGYEKNRWNTSPIVNDVYTEIQVDTTFALYQKNHYFIGGGSTGFPYIARHYPWELTKEDYDNDDEFKYYIQHASHSSSYKTFLNL
jgi:glycosyltransferase involved in cell wall biosynthesis